MTRKCNDCKTTKNLKNIWVEEDENGNLNMNKSCCANCFFDNGYELDHPDTITKENWNDYDYHWKRKNPITKIIKCDGK